MRTAQNIQDALALAPTMKGRLRARISILRLARIRTQSFNACEVASSALVGTVQHRKMRGTLVLCRGDASLEIRREIR